MVNSLPMTDAIFIMSCKLVGSRSMRAVTRASTDEGNSTSSMATCSWHMAPTTATMSFSCRLLANSIAQNGLPSLLS